MPKIPLVEDDEVDRDRDTRPLEMARLLCRMAAPLAVASRPA